MAYGLWLKASMAYGLWPMAQGVYGLWPMAEWRLLAYFDGSPLDATMTSMLMSVCDKFESARLATTATEQ